MVSVVIWIISNLFRKFPSVVNKSRQMGPIPFHEILNFTAKDSVSMGFILNATGV